LRWHDLFGDCLFDVVLQLTGCFIAHLCAGVSRVVRSEGLLSESSGSWYAWGIYLHIFGTILVMYCKNSYSRL